VPSYASFASAVPDRTVLRQVARLGLGTSPWRRQARRNTRKMDNATIQSKVEGSSGRFWFSSSPSNHRPSLQNAVDDLPGTGHGDFISGPVLRRFMERIAYHYGGYRCVGDVGDSKHLERQAQNLE